MAENDITPQAAVTTGLRHCVCIPCRFHIKRTMSCMFKEIMVDANAMCMQAEPGDEAQHTDTADESAGTGTLGGALATFGRKD